MLSGNSFAQTRSLSRGATRGTAYNEYSHRWCSSCSHSLYNFVINCAPWALESRPRVLAPPLLRPHAALRLLALQRSVERRAGRDRAHQWSRSAEHCATIALQAGVEGEFGEVCARASTPTPCAGALGVLCGSPGCFRAVSGGSAPDVGLPEPEQGTPGHGHASSNGRALLLAQDRRWRSSAAISVIALSGYGTPIGSYSCPTAFRQPFDPVRPSNR